MIMMVRRWAISFWIDEGRIKHRLGEMVGGRVDEGLNAMLDAEADRFVVGL